ncbi:MAG: hypothetical protein B7C24_07085 [Bacteroidetes bacterium 4572_77]|nr:MAG: hypothetical protein B7C24_07085 [Bacteroidetes bacterium 4572_77]
MNNQDLIKTLKEEILQFNNQTKELSLLKDIINRGPSIVFRWKNEEGWPVEYVSANVKKVFGYTQKEFMQNNIAYIDTIFKEDLNRIIDEVEKNSKTNKSRFTHKPYRIVNKSNKIVWVDDRTEIIKNKEGEITHYQGVIIDITDSQEKKEISILYEQLKKKNKRLISNRKALVDSEIKYRNLIESTNTGYLITDTNGYVIDANQEYVHLSGHKKLAEIAGRNILHWTAPYHAEKNKKGFQECLKKQLTKHLEIDYINKKHQITSIEINASVIIQEGKEVVLALCNNITERKKAEKLQSVLLNISQHANNDTTVTKHTQYIQKELGRIMDTTNFFVALYNKEEDSISIAYYADQKDHIPSFPAGKTLTGYLIKEQKSLMLSNKQILEMERMGILKSLGSPSEIWLGVPLFVKGQIIGAYVIQSYLDEKAYNESDLHTLELVSTQISAAIARKQAKEDLKKALEKAQESDQLKSAFLANMSHEIRTPMNGILGFTELLKEPDISSDEKEKFLQIITKSGHNMLEIINNIVDFSKIEAGLMSIKKEKHHINGTLNYLYDFFLPKAHNKGIELMVSLGANDKEDLICVDQRKINDALTNLINNAIKYTDKGKIEFGYTKNEYNMLFFVKDTGHGISKKEQINIFDRFIQSKTKKNKAQEGTGLGLAISKAYIEMHEGTIQVSSKLGKGSFFSFSIPLRTHKNT